MESAKHSLQDQLLLPSSSSSTLILDSSSYTAATTTGSAHICWTPNNILNCGSFGSYANAGGALVNSRNSRLQNDILVSSVDSSMTHDLSFDWADSTGSTTFTHSPCSHDLQLSQIKLELSESYSKFDEMISSPSSTVEDVQNQPTTCYSKEQRDINDINVKLILRALSSGGQSDSIAGLIRSCPENLYCSSSPSPAPAPAHMRGTFSQIYPTINVSNFRQTPLPSSTFHMNLQAMDLFHSAGLEGSLRYSLQDQLGLSTSGLSYGLDYMKQSIQRPLLNSGNVTPFSGRVTEAKRSGVASEPKAPQAAAKRSRLESRASCPPFKVRKEKLGDRIAALQQLVAPFGKTDTASVLMEAIGYIKFLQNQVETLSVPYLKSSRNKAQRTHVQGGPAENGSHAERNRDLRSQGLCLVPLSCLSYMTDSGGAVWPPPNFGGGT